MNQRDITPSALQGSYLGQSKALKSIRAFHPDLIKIRHQIHQNPELGFEEIETAELVARELASYGIDEIHRGLGVTGVVAVINGQAQDDAAASGRVVGLRADMDALPMQEANEFAPPIQEARAHAWLRARWAHDHVARRSAASCAKS